MMMPCTSLKCSHTFALGLGVFFLHLLLADDLDGHMMAGELVQCQADLAEALTMADAPRTHTTPNDPLPILRPSS